MKIKLIMIFNRNMRYSCKGDGALIEEKCAVEFWGTDVHVNIVSTCRNPTMHFIFAK